VSGKKDCNNIGDTPGIAGLAIMGYFSSREERAFYRSLQSNFSGCLCVIETVDLKSFHEFTYNGQGIIWRTRKGKGTGKI
jgi:hypothetical protein